MLDNDSCQVLVLVRVELRDLIGDAIDAGGYLCLDFEAVFEGFLGQPHWVFTNKHLVQHFRNINRPDSKKNRQCVADE